jgi:hypothetical protein
VAVPFLIAAQAALQAQASARSRVGLRDNSLADAVRCTRHAASQAALQPAHAPALASGPASVLARALVSAQVWVELPGSFRLQVRLRVHSVQVVRLVVAVRPTKRVKKAQ